MEVYSRLRKRQTDTQTDGNNGNGGMGGMGRRERRLSPSVVLSCLLVLGAGEGRALGFSTLSTLHSLELG